MMKWTLILLLLYSQPAHLLAQKSSKPDSTTIFNGTQLPIFSEQQRELIKSPKEGMVIYNSTARKPQYFDGQVWIYFTVSHNNVEQKEIPHLVGEIFQGGVIFYLDASGKHGLIAALEDQSVNAQWGYFDKEVTKHGKALGTGLLNTEQVFKAAKDSSIAAVICYNLELNSFNDWYLPSKDELDLMYRNLKMNKWGKFSDGDYWSSSETDFNNAWLQNFGTGIPIEKNVIFQAYVRAIRSF